MTILLTAGIGKTSTHIASLLSGAGIPFILTSRNPQPSPNPSDPPDHTTPPTVKFDWLNPTTFSAPFTHPYLSTLPTNQQRIDTVYIIPPETEDYTDALIEFVDLAVDVYGVKRFVMLSGSEVEMGGEKELGGVWGHVVHRGVGWAMLRSTWFMDNYKGPQYVHTIKNEGKIYSACGDGKIPFVSTKDIAAVAFRALTDEKAWNTDVRVLGGELLSLDDVAAKFTKALNKPVEHVKLSEKEMGNLYRETGMPGHIADLIAWMEAYSATGVEERMSDTVEKVTGRMPVRFEEMIEESREVWL